MSDPASDLEADCPFIGRLLLLRGAWGGSALLCLSRGPNPPAHHIWHIDLPLLHSMPLTHWRLDGRQLQLCKNEELAVLVFDLGDGGECVQGRLVLDPLARYELQVLHPGACEHNRRLEQQLAQHLSAEELQRCRCDPDAFAGSCTDEAVLALLDDYVREHNLPFYHWRERFEDYFISHDVSAQLARLCAGMDRISCEYVRHFMKLAAHWRNAGLHGSLWTRHDLQLLHGFEEFKRHFVQPHPQLLEIEPYYYFQRYGLADLPEEVHRRIDGRIIIDAGAFNGDTALMFHHFYPHSPIHAFEPGPRLQVLQEVLRCDDCGGMIIPDARGVGVHAGRGRFDAGTMGTVSGEFAVLDEVFQDPGRRVGLIKLDTESYETANLEGASSLIRRDHPVLVVAMYHTPYDFFGLKGYIQHLYGGYRFMIRRSEPVLPQADLVLVAWEP